MFARLRNRKPRIAHGVPFEVTRTARLYARFHTARTRDVRCRPADVDYG